MAELAVHVVFHLILYLLWHSYQTLLTSKHPLVHLNLNGMYKKLFYLTLHTYSMILNLNYPKLNQIFAPSSLDSFTHFIDAPEIKRCAKLIQDERETHIPGSLLMTLGNETFDCLRQTVLPSTLLKILPEEGNLIDKFGRSINEIMLENGFVKPYDKVYCSKLPEYQAISLEAKHNRNGLFKHILSF